MLIQFPTDEGVDMPKTLTLDGAPSNFFRPDDDLLNKWRKKRCAAAADQKKTPDKTSRRKTKELK